MMGILNRMNELVAKHKEVRLTPSELLERIHLCILNKGANVGAL